MRDLWEMSDEEREAFGEEYYSKLKKTLLSYINELDNEEKESTVTFDLINSWGKGELVLMLMGLVKKEGIEIL